ncbi:MAG: MptD family putative ECF transporter S component [Ruminococcus sp.]
MGIVIGVYLWITDLIDKSGNYKSAAKTVVGNGIFHIILFGNFLPIYLNADEYFSTRQSFGQEYTTYLSNIMQPWTASLLSVLELFLHLAALELPDSPDEKPYFYRTQAAEQGTHKELLQAGNYNIFTSLKRVLIQSSTLSLLS